MISFSSVVDLLTVCVLLVYSSISKNGMYAKELVNIFPRLCRNHIWLMIFFSFSFFLGGGSEGLSDQDVLHFV